MSREGDCVRAPAFVDRNERGNVTDLNSSRKMFPRDRHPRYFNPYRDDWVGLGPVLCFATGEYTRVRNRISFTGFDCTEDQSEVFAGNPFV